MNFTYPYKTYYAELPGKCRVAYIDEGTGPCTLLMVHGLANYALAWKKNVDYLSQYYRCIAIDLPGNGLSDQEDHPFTMNFFADTVFHFIQALGLENVCLTGHSMGGQVSLMTLIKYPNCANKLALVAPAGFETFTKFEKGLYHTTMRIIEHISSEEHSLRKIMDRCFYQNKTQGEGMVQDLVEILKTYKLKYYRNMVEACIEGMLEEPVYDMLGSIAQPVLVIFGTHDALIPNKIIHHTTTQTIAEDGVARLPHARLHLLPDAGHFVHCEKAAEVNALIKNFLDGASGIAT